MEADSVHVLVVTVADTGIQPIKAVRGTEAEAQEVAKESDLPLWVLGSAEVVSTDE